MSFNLYAFGCSFTHYVWPTWADILGNYADDYKNYGRSGVGNYYIFYNLMHFIVNHKHTENDLIAVSWTNFCREDRIKNKEWLNSGPLAITNKKEFGESFINSLFDMDHYLERDRLFIITAIELLEAKKLNYIMFDMEDISFKGKYLFENKIKDYSKYHQKILPSISATAMDFSPDVKRPRILCISTNKPIPDPHPLPTEHLKYVEDIILPNSNLQLTIDDEYKQKIKEITERLYN